MVNVTACLVTRGNVDMQRTRDSLPKHWQQIVWDNSDGLNLSVAGRYCAALRAQTKVVYVQDDDCVLPPESLSRLEAAYAPGVLTANMPLPFREHYTDSCLVGFGAIFDRALVTQAFQKMPSIPRDFLATCDVYFTALVEDQTWLDLPYENLPWATADDRMYRQPEHTSMRHLALERARDMR